MIFNDRLMRLRVGVGEAVHGCDRTPGRKPHRSISRLEQAVAFLSGSHLGSIGSQMRCVAHVVGMPKPVDGAVRNGPCRRGRAPARMGRYVSFLRDRLERA